MILVFNLDEKDVKMSDISKTNLDEKHVNMPNISKKSISVDLIYSSLSWLILNQSPTYISSGGSVLMTPLIPLFPLSRALIQYKDVILPV